MHKRGLAVVRWLGDWMSVTFVYCAKTVIVAVECE